MIFGWFKKEPPKEEVSELQPCENFENPKLIADYFERLTGVTFQKQESILRSRLSSFCRRKKILSFESLLASLKDDNSLEQELVNFLTTNETYFFREYAQIEKVVHSLKQNPRKVTILSAPCATGEEPYSIAIAAVEAGIESSLLSIVGIDINADAIESARQAFYKERNIRNLSKAQQERYFTLEEGLYKLSPDIKKMVDFKVVNIFESAFETLGKFDFIFSRNMLIYFDAPRKLEAQKRLHSLLKDPSQELFFGHADLF